MTLSAPVYALGHLSQRERQGGGWQVSEPWLPLWGSWLARGQTERASQGGIPMSVKKNSQMLPRARELRRDMTPQERKLWYLFLRKYPVKIYKQRIIDSFIVDFYCASAKLAIEIDGSQHYTEQGQSYDTERSACLARYGLKVIRFSNADVDYRFDTVCAAIHAMIQDRREGNHP